MRNIPTWEDRQREAAAAARQQAEELEAQHIAALRKHWEERDPKDEWGAEMRRRRVVELADRLADWEDRQRAEALDDLAAVRYETDKAAVLAEWEASK